ncbi:Erythritol/L-threitol dehydrogenase [Gracilariopsis chorda]|uniref:Erythritol/L-threitol dehydrogenase n=1 Tax=Gracilariopsis chorda TaxID=448386 RepID=A0A2V3IKR7_9FLOR|nr:Erythritol/L-threitol dehydrogenase [Gracilariopsis chorda]|eukprot:PXF42653.1 Erythritol/L-threitol dehydrogenase [Gracilariopsis chorda]
MAQYMKIPPKAIVHAFPNSLHVQEMVYTEPLSCSVHGVERAEVGLGDVVVVSGCGAIGLGIVAAARLRGPSRLVAVDLNDDRLEVARECGADVVLNPKKDDVVETVRSMTSGYGCDVYMEASGAPSSVEQGLQCCRKAANFLEFSVFTAPTTVDWTVIGDTKELNIKGGHCSGDRGYATAIDMLRRGLLPTDKIVSHSLGLGDVVEGIDMVLDGKKSIKVTVDPQLE